MYLLNTVRIVLVAPSHPGNIGASARAMKTMGLSQLVLVTPRYFPHEEASALAAGAEDVLANARVVSSLFDATADCHYVLGCTPRARKVAMPELTPREASLAIIPKITQTQNIAIVFGTERSGLDNDQIQQCHAAINIPANVLYDSLNLAQAVQVICYELRMAVIQNEGLSSAIPLHERHTPDAQDIATMEALEGFFSHLQETLAEVDFFKGRPFTTVMRRLRRLFFRAQLSEPEVMLLRGIFSDVQRVARIVGYHRK